MTATAVGQNGDKDQNVNEFARGWPIVLASIIGIYASLATLPFYAIQNLFGPLQDAFGWSRTDISAAITLMGAANLFSSYLFGRVADHFGSRPVALISGLLLAVSLYLITLNSGNLQQFWLSYFLMTIAATGTLPLTYTRTVNQWFDKSRGLALGLTLLGTSLAAITLPPLYKMGIDAFGWKGVFYVAIAIILVLWLPVFLLLFRDRSAVDQQAAAQLATGVSLGEAARTGTFWKMGIAFFFVTFAMSGIAIHIVAMMTDNGVNRGDAVKLASLIGISLLVSRLVVGYLIDKMPAQPIAALCFAVPALGCYLLMGGGHGPAMVAVILVGVALGAELDLIAFFTSRYFGMKNYGRIYGWQYVFYTLGAGLSPLAFGYAYDTFKSYDPVLVASAIGLLVAGGLMMMLPKYGAPGH
jgi:predicted MFS family arabinose efflux permease